MPIKKKFNYNQSQKDGKPRIADDYNKLICMLKYKIFNVS